jgi:2-polyprenyl-6-methoxyphenol hydroxylase-like FAD-dependent oxidoreductase
LKVVVCGAGIAGLTLANRLAESGIEVVLLERAAAPRGQGYMIDFFGPGVDALDAMGLLAAVEKISYRIEEASLVDEHGRRRAGVRPAQFANGPLLDVMRPDLERVLRDHLPPSVDVRYGTGPVQVLERRDGVGVVLDGGATLHADLLVGADGVHSTVRRLVFGDEARFVRYLGFHTCAFVFDAPEVHAVVRERACLTDSVGRQMGFYGLRDGRVAAFAVHRTPDAALPRDVRAAVRAAYSGLGWVVPVALDRCPPSAEIYYDVVAQVEVPCWSRGRVVLVGDAGYAVSLLAGQGASLGVAGAFVLAEQLARHESIDAAVASYERLWRPVAEEKQRAGRAAARWFLPATTGQLRVRRAALRLARLPVLDRAVGAIVGGKPSAVVKAVRAEPR